MRRRWSAAAVALTGCLASPPSSKDGGVEDRADATPPEPAIDAWLIGDLLTLDFNDETGSYLLVDRSGASRHADMGGGSFLAGGVFGAARTLNGGGSIFLPRDAELGPGGGSGFTLEAHVLLYTGGQVATVASDYLAADPTVTFDLQLQNETTLEFTSNADGEEGSVPSDSITLPLETWSHVAVTWNGAALVFYLDGMPVGSNAGIATISIPDDNRFVHIGGRADGTAPLLGAVDEVKISSYAKSQGEVQASMAYDSRDLVGRCGDNLLEDGEVCAGAGLCCSDDCAPLAEDPVCAEAGGTCGDGLCDVADATRVESGIVAYYTFDEVLDGGSRIPDKSEVGTPADLLASVDVESQDGGVTLNGDTVLRTVAASKIAEQCIETDEVAASTGGRPIISCWSATRRAAAGPGRAASTCWRSTTARSTISRSRPITPPAPNRSSYRPRTSRMVYRPGGREASQAAARRAPAANRSREPARWVSSRRSPSPRK
jgi:hypothetical protein